MIYPEQSKAIKPNPKYDIWRQKLASSFQKGLAMKTIRNYKQPSNHIHY